LDFKPLTLKRAPVLAYHLIRGFLFEKNIMALRDQPYFPFYVQDYLTDEKLNMCSASSQGVYIKILCFFHKSDTYGGVLYKQNNKQNLGIMEYFAFAIQKQIGFSDIEIENALEELLENNVLTLEGDFLFQKRMVKDFNISLKRSESGKKGGGNPNLFKQKDKQPIKQNIKLNPEYEIEYENEIVFENRLSVEEEKKESEKSKRFTPEQIQQLRSQNKCPLPDDYPVKWEAYIPAITEPERYCTEKGVVIDLLPESEIMAMPSEVIREYASQMWALGADGYARQVGYLSDDKLKLERQLEEEEDLKNYQ